jgi:signal transduction histidine kinase
MDDHPRGRLRVNLPSITNLDLEPLEGIFRDSAGLVVPAAVRDRAYRHARVMSEALGGGAQAEYFARLEFAADMIAAFAVELCEQLPQLRGLINRIEGSAGIARGALGCEVLRATQLPHLPSPAAIQVQLTLLVAFADAAAASIWAVGTGELLEQIASAGEVDLDGDVRRLARMVLTRELGPGASDQSLSGVLLDRPRASPAAVILRGKAESSADRDLLLESAVSNLSTMFARDEPASHRASEDQQPPNSAARALSRLRFDLHDGPQQDVIMLAEDLRMFRDQLANVVENAVTGVIRDRILGRLDDLEARLVALEGDLRRISGSLLSPFLLPKSVPDSIAEIVKAFAERTEVVPEINLEGDLDSLSESQQIALLAVIRESLSNIREHSDARHVTISVSRGGEVVDATVTDDGRGFDPETALVSAARRGHLGLVGMHERVRLLGGQTKIDSRPGGPTVISVSLPAWPVIESPRE